MWEVFKNWIFDIIQFFFGFCQDWGLAIIIVTIIATAATIGNEHRGVGPDGPSEASSTSPAIARAILQLHQSDILGTRGHDKPVVPSNQGGDMG